MRRIGVVAACCAVVLVPLGGAGVRPLPLRGPQPATAEPMGILSGRAGSRLVRLDPRTLRPVASSRRMGYADAWTRSPDGTLLAVAARPSGDPNGSVSVLHFANVSTLRWVRGAGVRLDGMPRALVWESLDRLVALVDDVSTGASELETVDAAAGRVVGRQSLDGVVGSVVPSAGGLVVLLERRDAIAPARLALVAGDGSVRTVGVGRILAGSSWPQDSGQDPIGTLREPGLAVDPAGTAYLLDADGLVAAVDLATLSVSYHDLAGSSVLARLAGWLVPAAQAKGSNGPLRWATWLGDGLIALTGSDDTAVRQTDGSVAYSGAGAGLSVVDTRDWTVRSLDPRADAVTVADGALLATGGTWRYDASGPGGSGEGVVAYGPDGSVRWQLFPGTHPSVIGSLRGLALVQKEGSTSYLVVDADTGAVVRTAPPSAESPWLLVGAGSP